MEQTTFSVRMDSDVKRRFDDFCDELGTNTTAAFTMFVHNVLKEKRLPFEPIIEVDPFYSESNLAHLRRGMVALNSGQGVEHDIIEVQE